MIILFKIFKDVKVNRVLFSLCVLINFIGVISADESDQLVKFHSIGLKEKMLVDVINGDDFEVSLDGLNKIQSAGLPQGAINAYKDKIMKRLGQTSLSNQVDVSEKKIINSEIEKKNDKPKVSPKDLVIDSDVEYFVGSSFVRFNVKSFNGLPSVYIFGKTKEYTHFIFSEEGRNPVYRKVHVDFLDKLDATLKKGYKADAHMDNPMWEYKKVNVSTGELARAPTRNRFRIDFSYGDNPYGVISFTSDEGEEFDFYVRPDVFNIMEVICNAPTFYKTIDEVVIGENLPIEVVENESPTEVQKRIEHMKQQIADVQKMLKGMTQFKFLLNKAPNVIKIDVSTCINNIRDLKEKTNYPIGAINFRYIGSKPRLVVTNEAITVGTDAFPKDDQGRLMTSITHDKMMSERLRLLLEHPHDASVFVVSGWMTVVIDKGIKKGLLSKSTLIDTYYLELNHKNYKNLTELSDSDLAAYCESNLVKGLPPKLRK